MRTAASFLVLLALSSLASAQLYTKNELEGLANSCENGHALSKADCVDCVNTLGSPDSAIQVSGKAWACHGLCQDVTANLVSPCLTCLNSEDTTAYGCQACLQAEGATGATATACITCISNNPLENAPATLNLGYLNDAYMSACAQCSTLTDSEAYTKCFTCISTWDAKPQAQGGILTEAEMEHPKIRPNDFGACVSLANKTQNINAGNFGDVTGIEASCVPKPNDPTPTGLSPASCIQCIEDVSATSYPGQPSFLNKEFGCYAYCQKAATPALAGTCVNCLTSEFPMDAWGCGNCLNPLFNADACFTCVASDPYKGKTSNYNWACGQCSAIQSESLRALCMQCIMSQPLPDFNDPNAAATGIFNKTTEANICSCIDLTLNNTIALNHVLDAQQRACFQPHVFYNKATPPVLVTPDIPWGTETNLYPDGDSSPCLECIAVASASSPDQGLNKKYGCTEYCQDPSLITSYAQGEACASCVMHPLVANPFGCKMCAEASDDDTIRSACYSCVKAPNSFKDKEWGCSMCSAFSALDVRTACFECLAAGSIQPCDCVDKAKNGTLIPSDPPVQGCAPESLIIWFWTWKSSALASATWTISSGPSGSGTVFASGLITGSDATLLFTNNALYRAYSLKINLPSDVVFPASAYLSMSNAVATNNGVIVWDLEQDAFGTGVSFQLIDSCGAVLIDTITSCYTPNTQTLQNTPNWSLLSETSQTDSTFPVSFTPTILNVANMGFESGNLAGWTAGGPNPGAVTVACGAGAAEGSCFAQISASGTNPYTGPNTLSRSDLVVANPSVCAKVQATIKFSYRFTAGDYMPFNDYFTVQVLQNNAVQFVDTINVQQVGNYGSIGWKSYSGSFLVNAGASVTYTISMASKNVLDGSLPSTGYFDGLQISTITV